MCVYFVRKRRRGSNLIKIGRTADCPYTRLDQLRSAELKKDKYSRYELLGVVFAPPEHKLSSQIFKDHLHRQFGELRSEGDWFRPGKALLQYVVQFAQPHICDATCYDGPFAEEEMRSNDDRSSKAFMSAFRRAGLLRYERTDVLFQLTPTR